MLEAVLVLNAIWFAMGFHAFYIRRRLFAKVVVPNRKHRDNSAYEAIIETGRFMGGFNLALSALNILLLLNVGGFDKDSQWATLLIFNAIAHGSQFAGNIPMALQNRRGNGLWNVFKGVMLRIFVIDFTLMVFNTVLAMTLVL
ncbi:hypothetical protein [Sphingorhabdus sp. Alg239-R122]|uniref:hypothetical protein n=1 Tax=Sphingorhabdus sp. Alg239-R122 TaxID=2305989 RepID=UPI0013DAAB74|nr:hypothetical protein [Sphingorhabdus sp. Alg239-R122]